MNNMEDILFAFCIVLIVQILILLWFRRVLFSHSDEMKSFLKKLNEPKHMVIESVTLKIDEVKND